MSDLAYKKLIGELYERVREFEMSSAPLPYDRQLEVWAQSSKWAAREAQRADDLVALLDQLIEEAER